MLLEALRAAWERFPPEPDLRQLVPEPLLRDGEILNSLLFVDAPQRSQRDLPATLAYYLTILPDLAPGSKSVHGLLLHEIDQREDRFAPEVAARLKDTYGARFARDVDRTVGFYRDLHPEGTEPPARELAPGQRLDKYELREFIDEGSYGEVWKAWDLELQRHVALKLIRPAGSAAGDPMGLLAEARASAAIHHPNVVNVHRAGVLEGGRIFLDTQLCGDPAPTPDDPHDVAVGDSLEVLAANEHGQRMFSPRQAARVVAAAARGVAAAHAQNVIHRDLKPRNVLVSPATSTVMVTDFGLAAAGLPRPAAHDPEAGPGRTVVVEIQDGRHIVGTPAYMAPEQARGDDVNRASDVYGLGATLYHLLTLKHPYEVSAGHDSMGDPHGHRDVLKQVADPGIGPESLPDSIPLNLRRIWARATAPGPDDRYETADQLAADLESWAAGRIPPNIGPATWYEPARQWCRRNPVVLVVTLLGLITAITAAWLAGGFMGSAAKERDLELMSHLVHIAPLLERGPDQVDVIEKVRLLATEIEGVYADNPLMLAQWHAWLSDLFWSAGLQADAVRHRRQAHALYSAELGGESAQAIQIAAGLAMGSHHIGDFTTCERVARMALGFLEGTQSKSDRLTTALSRCLGVGMSMQGRHDEAIRWLEETARLDREARGITEQQVLRSHEFLAEAYAECGRFEQALPVIREVVDVGYETFGPDDPWVWEWQHGLGLVYLGLGQLDDAERELAASYGQRRCRLGPCNPETLRTLDGLARLAAARGNDEEATLLWRTVLADAARLGDAHNEFYIVDTKRVFGRFLVERGHLNEAEPLLLESYAVQERTGGPASERALDTAVALAELRAVHGERTRR
ncbi:MAG: serine/threonine-protein kinase [Planctomycetota bacterium]